MESPDIIEKDDEMPVAVAAIIHRFRNKMREKIDVALTLCV